MTDRIEAADAVGAPTIAGSQVTSRAFGSARRPPKPLLLRQPVRCQANAYHSLPFGSAHREPNAAFGLPRTGSPRKCLHPILKLRKIDLRALAGT